MPATPTENNPCWVTWFRMATLLLLITPIDTEAPEGRLILPQVQAIRDLLDNDCVAIVLKEREAGCFSSRNRH